MKNKKNMKNNSNNINYLIDKYKDKDKYNFLNANVNNNRDEYFDKEAYKSLNETQISQLLKTVKRRYDYFNKKLDNKGNNPYGNYGFIDKETNKALTYEQLKEKYGYRTNYKVNLLYHISGKNFLQSRNSIFKVNLIKMYDTMGNEDKVIELLNEGLSKTMRKYYLGEYDIVETYKDYNAVKEASKLSNDINPKLHNIDDGKK